MALIQPILMEVFRNRWTQVDPIKDVIIGGSNPDLIGSRPLFNGKKAPPHPEIVPHIIGPNRGKEKREGAIVLPVTTVNFNTTDARITSYRMTTVALR